MNNYDDLYNDLPEETTSDYIAKIENQLQSVQKQYDDSQTFIKQLTDEKHNQKKRIRELEKVVENLTRNMSSLYKTAIEEIKRKDSTIDGIRSEFEDLSFRRKKCANCDRDIYRDHRNNRERHLRDSNPIEELDEDPRRNREQTTHDEFKPENDDLTFRGRHRSKNCDRDTRDRWNNRGLYHKDGSPVDEKYKPKVRCKKLLNGKRRHDERQRFDVRREKSDSLERNDRRNGEFYTKEKHLKSLPKMIDGKEIRSISPRDRIENSFDIKNRSEVRKEHRSSRENLHKSYNPSNIRNSPEAQTSSQYVRNEPQSQNKYSKPQIISSNTKNKSESKTTATADQKKSFNGRIEKPSGVETDPIKQNSSNLLKIEHSSQQNSFRSLVKSSPTAENTPANINTRTENSSNIENNLETVPDRSKKLIAEKLVALFGTDDIPTPNILVNDKNENHTKEKEKPAQRNGYLRCEAALLSMKKHSCRLLTPIKDTPDLLKEKFSQIESNKINPVIPMINERRMLSPYKNVAIVEIVSQNDNESESSKATESETITSCSVTVSEDIEHGVFSRKNRKRPRIHKIVTNVKKVATC